MSNKSFTTKGLSRQLEEKANKLQTDLTSLRGKHTEVRSLFDDETRKVQKLEDELRDRHQDADVQTQKLQDRHDLLRHEHEGTLRRCENLNNQLQQAVRDLQNKSEEKDLLHSRHDALTVESQALQKELSRARSQTEEAENGLRQEREHAEENDRRLRSEAQDEISRLNDGISALQRQNEDQRDQFVADRDQWESQMRDVQSQKYKVDERAAGLQRTISKLQEAEGTLSSTEMKLQDALESEKQRHRSEEVVLETRLQELKVELDDKRQDLDEIRTELSHVKESLQASEREQANLEEKVQEMDEEVEVLLSERDGEEAMKTRQKLESLENEAENLHAQLIETQQKLDEAEASAPKDLSNEMQELRSSFEQVQRELRTTGNERKSLEDRLASKNQELQQAETALAEIEAEKDELQGQLEQRHNKADDTYKLDQEKIDLRTTKVKLESEIKKLHNERKMLVEAKASTQQKLEAEIHIASEEQGHLMDRISELQHRLPSQDSQDDVHGNGDLLRQEVTAARVKENEYVRREAAQKEILRDLKSKVSKLERHSHETEIAKLSADSPKSSVAGSARKNEIVDLQRQLTEAHQQLRDIRHKFNQDLKSLQKRLAETERQAQADLDSFDKQREQLEADLSNSRHEQEILQAKNVSATQTITRLRTRISSLEQDLHSHRQSATADNTIAEERADLHEMLKDAKLQAEDLQVQITARKTSLSAATAKEKDLRTQLRRVREERNLQAQKSRALNSELDALQSRYERSVDKLSSQQQKWEDERKAMMSRVRFANMETSSIMEGKESKEKMEKRHAAELRGLGKQIMWLRARFRREEGFKVSLVQEKKYLGMQVQMFEAWYVPALSLSPSHLLALFRWCWW